MPVHEDVLIAVNQTILPDVMRVHQTGVPYPAELWVKGKRMHENGAAMFEIGARGFLTAEYFAYDDFDEASFWTGAVPQCDAMLVMTGLDLKIPIWCMRAGHKARTFNSRDMPAVRVYECEIQGWIGGDDTTPVRSASMTLSGLPNIRLPRSRIPISEESTDVEGVSLLETTIKSAVLTLDCDDWQIRLREGGSDWERKSPTVYLATLAKNDSSVFMLGEDQSRNDIIDALFRFLSFQSGSWISIPTIICHPEAVHDRVVKRAWLGKLSSDDRGPRNVLTAADWNDWPKQFNEFWKKYTDKETHNHLRHAVQHYVDCSRIFDDDALNYSVVASISTLQALTRWWNQKDEDFRFGSSSSNRFHDLLLKAVQKAKLGMDHEKQIEPDRLSEVMRQAIEYRNRIDHGQGGTTGLQTQQMVDCQMYCHNLARLLILAQLGDRGTYQSGYPSGPKFIARRK